MKKIAVILLLFISYLSFSQVRGIVTDVHNYPLSTVGIYLKNSVTGATSNESGRYQLSIREAGEYTIFFQFLGYKTLQKQVSITTFPFELNVQLEVENIILDEFSISTKENPANEIIRNAIKSRDKNTNKFANYTAKFYSRGMTKIKNAPEKILGQTLGDLGGGLDSTRSGIVYLSETFSEISFQKEPKQFKEKITASKVSGQDNGVSFNRAAEATIDLYSNNVELGGGNIVSPISSSAFSYYKYKLEGSFYNKNGKLINKIQLIPRRKRC